MVAGAIIIVGAVIVGLVIFKDQIANFISGGITGTIDSTKEGLENIGGSIFDAGAGAGRAFADAQAIKEAEAEIKKAAKDSGFESVEAFNKASDSGSIVIGGEVTTVDFGLIGDVIPTNPSKEFIASAEGQALLMNNAEFKTIVEAQVAQEGTTPENVSLSLQGINLLSRQMEENQDSFAFARFGGRRRR